MVALALTVDLAYFILLWVKYRNEKITWFMPQDQVFILSTWFISFLYFTVVWISRISLALSLARIFLPGERYRAWTIRFAILLVFVYTGIVLVTTFTCPGSPWWQLDYSKCITTSLGTRDLGTIISVVCDVVVDVALVAAPLLMLWRIDLPRRERTLILILFSAGILTLLVTILYCTLWYLGFRFGEDSKLVFAMLGHMQAALSLLACNLLVVIMLIYKRFSPSMDEDSSDETNDTPANPRKVTTRTHFTTTEAPSYTVITAPSAVNSSVLGSNPPLTSDNSNPSMDQPPPSFLTPALLNYTVSDSRVSSPSHSDPS
ncbi:hypothetical protein NLJ89_g4460 [Agrocybe chaxingu]|uniref:Rhodopsin domain-containing protein n=1 Tax=Agrocybe chaxingu TaxID=84603 RepID=A0A9W8K2M9_9AGAR|nr:hypothetical protein NLJ89_g4460 [Agrocybe chaxingu]